MSRRFQDNVVAAALLVVFGGVIWLCQDFGPRARMIPLPLAIFGLILTLLQIVWQNTRSTDELQMNLLSVPDRAEANAPVATTRASPPTSAWRSEARAYGLVVLLVAIIVAIGIIPAVFVFTAGYFVLTRQYSWVSALAYTAVFTASLYLLFVTALQIEPYHGLIGPLFARS